MRFVRQKSGENITLLGITIPGTGGDRRKMIEKLTYAYVKWMTKPDVFFEERFAFCNTPDSSRYPEMRAEGIPVELPKDTCAYFFRDVDLRNEDWIADRPLIAARVFTPDGEVTVTDPKGETVGEFIGKNKLDRYDHVFGIIVFPRRTH